ncbi:MAG: hypothetical protein Q4C96_05135 [Planctomycetia bacterium]|nr:hypothetical protein [Planctomycetia bacterium]
MNIFKKVQKRKIYFLLFAGSIIWCFLLKTGTETLQAEDFNRDHQRSAVFSENAYENEKNQNVKRGRPARTGFSELRSQQKKSKNNSKEMHLEEADVPNALSLEVPTEDLQEMDSVLRRSVSRRSTDNQADTKLFTSEIPDVEAPAFALPEDWCLEDMSDAQRLTSQRYFTREEYLQAKAPSSETDAAVDVTRKVEEVGKEEFSGDTRNMESFEKMEIPVLPRGEVKDLKSEGNLPEGSMPEISEEEESAFLGQLEKITQAEKPKLVKTEKESPAEKKQKSVVRRRYSSNQQKMSRGRPTISADPYQARPYYTPYVPTTGPGVLVLPR